MYNFILQIIIFSSLGVMIYLAARAMPRISDIASDEDKTIYGKLDELFAKIPFEKFDVSFSISLEKILRKIKLLLMKWDNIVTEHIKKIRKSNGSNISLEDKQTLFSDNEDDKRENN